MDDVQGMVHIVANVLSRKKIVFDESVTREIENEIRESYQGCQLYVTKNPLKAVEKTMKIREEYRESVRKICRAHGVSEAHLRHCVRTKPVKPKGYDE
jgi:predicted transcriptional regulator